MLKIGRKTPLTNSDSGDNLYQVNGVAYIEGNLKLIHLRILIVLISHLQAALRFKISRRRPGIKVPESMLPDPGVLSLRGATRTVRVKITEFGLTPRNCGRLRQYLEELIDMPVVFPGYRKEGMIFPELVHSFTGLITDYDFPVYSRTVDISLPETLVHRLLLTEEGFSDNDGEAVQAASLALSYYAAKYNDMVDCFILNTQNAGVVNTAFGTKSMNFQLKSRAQDVWMNLDSNQGYVESLTLPTIGIGSFSDVISGYGRVVDKEKIGAFVDRLYNKCLGRGADEGGRNNWVNALANGSQTGAGTAYGFF